MTVGKTFTREVLGRELDEIEAVSNEVCHQTRSGTSSTTGMKMSSLKENLKDGTRRKMRKVNRMLVLIEKAQNFRIIKKVRKTA